MSLPGKNGGDVLGNELLLHTVDQLPLGAGVQVVQQALVLLLHKQVQEVTQSCGSGSDQFPTFFSLNFTSKISIKDFVKLN